MPTANANTGNGFSKAVSYSMQEQKQLQEHERAEVLELNNVSGTSRDIGRQMRDIADDRERVQKPVLHIQINFHPDEKLNKEQATKAVDAVLKEVGISKENHQYVVVQHKDKAHDHYHIVANRVGMDGSLVSNDRIIERLQVACDKVEQEQGLRPTEGRTVFYDPSQEKGFRYATSEEKAIHREKTKKTIVDKNPKKDAVKKDIQNKVVQVLGDRGVTTPEQLQSSLLQKGIDVKFSSNKNGISGISYRHQGISVKGSQIDAKWGDVDKYLTTNAILSKEKEMRAYIDQNTTKNSLSSNVVDQAIREKMPEIRPNVNVWETWRKNPENGRLFNDLSKYSEELQAAKQEQKSAFDIAKERREQKPDDRERNQGFRR